MHQNLLLFAAQTALTTGVCVAEYLSWPELSPAEKVTLGQLYVPYFVFGESSFLFSSVFVRLWRGWSVLFLRVERWRAGKGIVLVKKGGGSF